MRRPGVHVGRWLTLLVACLAAGGLRCTSVVPCQTDDQCTQVGATCVQGRCRLPPDAGPGRDQAAADLPMGADRPSGDAGPDGDAILPEDTAPDADTLLPGDVTLPTDAAPDSDAAPPRDAGPDADATLPGDAACLTCAQARQQITSGTATPAMDQVCQGGARDAYTTLLDCACGLGGCPDFDECGPDLCQGQAASTTCRACVTAACGAEETACDGA